MACRSVEAARRASRFEGNDKPVLGRDAIVSRVYRGAEILDVAEIGSVYRQTMQCLLRVAAGQRRVDLGYMGVGNDPERRGRAEIEKFSVQRRGFARAILKRRNHTDRWHAIGDLTIDGRGRHPPFTRPCLS